MDFDVGFGPVESSNHGTLGRGAWDKLQQCRMKCCQPIFCVSTADLSIKMAWVAAVLKRRLQGRPTVDNDAGRKVKRVGAIMQIDVKAAKHVTAL